MAGKRLAPWHQAHADFVGELGGPTFVAKQLSLRVGQVDHWRRRGVPWKWRAKVVTLANSLGKMKSIPPGFLDPEYVEAA